MRRSNFFQVASLIAAPIGVLTSAVRRLRYGGGRSFGIGNPPTTVTRGLGALKTPERGEDVSHRLFSHPEGHGKFRWGRGYMLLQGEGDSFESRDVIFQRGEALIRVGNRTERHRALAKLDGYTDDGGRRPEVALGLLQKENAARIAVDLDYAAAKVVFEDAPERPGLARLRIVSRSGDVVKGNDRAAQTLQEPHERSRYRDFLDVEPERSHRDRVHERETGLAGLHPMARRGLSVGVQERARRAP